MKLLFALLIAILMGVHGTDEVTITKEGNITTTVINGQVYKSAESFIGEAWSYP